GYTFKTLLNIRHACAALLVRRKLKADECADACPAAFAPGVGESYRRQPFDDGSDQKAASIFVPLLNISAAQFGLQHQSMDAFVVVVIRLGPPLIHLLH